MEDEYITLLLVSFDPFISFFIPGNCHLGCLKVSMFLRRIFFVFFSNKEEEWAAV